MNERERAVLDREWYRGQLEKSVDNRIADAEIFELNAEQHIAQVYELETKHALHLINQVLRRRSKDEVSLPDQADKTSTIVFRKILNPISQEPVMRMIQICAGFSGREAPENMMISTMLLDPHHSRVQVAVNDRTSGFKDEASIHDMKDYRLLVQDQMANAHLN